MDASLTPAIRLERLSVRRGHSRVVSDVSLRVPAGSWFGLIGANGSGKTSLLRAVAGRIATESGKCEIDGKDFSHSRQERAQRIDFSPTSEALPGMLTPRRLFEMLAPEWRTSLGDIYDALAIESFVERPISSFSAGMRQRVAIACAFASGRPLVILDEPFNWLDPVAVYDLRLALRAWVEAGATLVTALHDMTTLALCCDEGALLTAGRVAAELSNEQLRRGRVDIHEFEEHMVHLLRRSEDVCLDER